MPLSLMSLVSGVFLGLKVDCSLQIFNVVCCMDILEYALSYYMRETTCMEAFEQRWKIFMGQVYVLNVNNVLRSVKRHLELF